MEKEEQRKKKYWQDIFNEIGWQEYLLMLNQGFLYTQIKNEYSMPKGDEL